MFETGLYTAKYLVLLKKKMAMHSHKQMKLYQGQFWTGIAKWNLSPLQGVLTLPWAGSVFCYFSLTNAR